MPERRGDRRFSRRSAIATMAGGAIFFPRQRLLPCTRHARCDLDLCNPYRRTSFNFDIHRQPHAYRLMVGQKGRNLMADGTAVPSA